MNIIIKDLKKKHQTNLTVEPEDTIRCIKRQLKETIKVSAQKIKLIYDKKIREDCVTLQELDIQNDSMLFMIVNPHD